MRFMKSGFRTFVVSKMLDFVQIVTVVVTD